MNIQAEKIKLVRLLLDTDNPKIIESIKNIFKKENATDFWDTISLKQQEEIKKASLEIKNGEVTDYESFTQNHR